MSNPLSDEEATKLFNEISSNMSDPNKVDELLKAAGNEEPAPSPEEETTPAVTEPEKPTPEKEEETPPSKEAETPPEEKVTEKAEAKEEPKDELAELRAQLDKVSKENHALRSQAGRVPHVQRKIKELDLKLEELSKKTASPSNRPSTAIQTKLAEKVKTIKDTDPELAAILSDVIDGIGAAADGVADESLNREKETLTLLRNSELETYRATQAERLLEMYPNAPDVFASASWKEWKSKQSAGVQALASSDSADDVGRAFKIYAEDMVIAHPELAKKTEEAKAAPVEAKPEDTSKAAQIEEERNRKKATAASVASPNAAGKSALPEDPEALFRKFSEDIRKQRMGD